jgi:hypothetical protein
MAPERATLLLCFGPHVVGQIEQPFYSDNTGHGLFRPALGNSGDPTVRRLCEYIAFSEDWHARLKTEQPYSAAEWDEFRDVYDSGLWKTVTPDGTVCHISGPVFVEGEVTW